MKILITGANGFIGRELTMKMIDNGHFVYALVTSFEDMADIKSDNLKIIKASFYEYGKLSSIINDDIDLVYHLAWAGLYGFSAGDIDLQLTNIKAINTMLGEIGKLGVKKIIFASSMNMLDLYGFVLSPYSHPPRKMYIHAASKMLAEIIFRNYCYENEIEFNSALIAMVYGERNKSKMITNVFIKSLINGESPKLASGDNPYDIIYVKDAVDALCSIGFHGVDKKNYYVGHNWNKTFKEIFSEIRDIINPNIELSFGSYKDSSFIDFSLVKKEELTIDTGWYPKYNFYDSIMKTMSWIQKEDISDE